MTTQVMLASTRALAPAFGWLGIQAIHPSPSGNFDRTRLADHDGTGGLYMRAGSSAMRSLVTVEVLPPERDWLRPNAEVAYDGPMLVPTGEILWLGPDGAPAGRVPFRVTPGEHRVVVQVAYRQESAAMGQAYINGPEEAEEPEPVEQWWVSIL